MAQRVPLAGRMALTCGQRAFILLVQSPPTFLRNPPGGVWPCEGKQETLRGKRDRSCSIVQVIQCAFFPQFELSVKQYIFSVSNMSKLSYGSRSISLEEIWSFPNESDSNVCEYDSSSTTGSKPVSCTMHNIGIIHLLHQNIVHLTGYLRS